MSKPIALTTPVLTQAQADAILSSFARVIAVDECGAPIVAAEGRYVSPHENV